MCILDDSREFGLSEDGFESDDGNDIGKDHVFEDGSGADAWQLVDIADEDGAGVIGDGDEERAHE